MDSKKQEKMFPLRLLVDKERNRVVVAEASGDLIDTLFSFLTLPLGTIIRLVSSNKQENNNVIGCINNLYESVENSSHEVFWNHICKQMLLFPRNSCESLCQRLKLKVDHHDTDEPSKYFMCGSCSRNRDRRSDLLLSTFEGASCSSCGKLMNKEMKLHGEDSNEETHDAGDDGVFVKGVNTYLVFDDLKVLQSSPSNFVKQLSQLGYTNFNKLTEMYTNVGFKQILDLLKQAFTSKSPLSDVFLANGESNKGMYTTFSPKIGPKNEHWINFTTISLKITLRKSKKKILYAETEGQFVDLLFSFLTAPLGSLLKLLDGNPSLGCMDNLYKSVKEDLNPSLFIRPSGTNPLMDLKVASQFGFPMQPLKLREEEAPYYWYGTGVIKNNVRYANADGVVSKNMNLVLNPGVMKLFDPRSPDGSREHAVGFAKRPSVFVVWDDLKMTTLANSSTISFMQKLDVPLDDLEEHVVRIQEAEALNLLAASLTSKAALTTGLFYLLKKPDEDAEKLAPIPETWIC